MNFPTGPLVAPTNARAEKVLLTEHFDEGLMVLRRQLGWDMIDVTYHAMLKTSAGEKRYDGKTLLNVPHYEDLSTDVSFVGFKERMHGVRAGLRPRSCG